MGTIEASDLPGGDAVEFHNVATIREVAGYEGGRLQRVPEAVRSGLNRDAQHRMLSPANVELRFVPDGPVEVTLACPNGAVRVRPFWGPYQGDPVDVADGECTVELAPPEKIGSSEVAGGGGFSPRVCRLVCRGNSGMRGEWMLFRRFSGEARPPTAEEVPDRRYLAYGTSITEGGASTGAHLSYPAVAARVLGGDLLNLGSSGSAHAEAALADHIAAREDWDIATLSLSVNMLGFSVEEFRERAAYFVETVAGENPDREVVGITIPATEFPAGDGGEKSAVFREQLREAVTTADLPNLHLVEGPELASPAGLSIDRVHPGDHGHRELGTELAASLEALL
jgi:lysophospholipase L1-like esterase